jgi:dihydrofolate reductase
MKFKLISALAQNGVIGREGTLPWHHREDLQRFKALTMGGRLLMGRKTFLSLGRLLPGREHWVLTHQDWSAPGVRVLRSLEEILDESGEVWVAGGAMVYQALLPYCSELFLTKLDEAYEGDVFFPPWEEGAFQCLSRERGSGCWFLHYVRRH